MKKLSLFLTIFISLFSFSQYPDPTGYINDYVDVIDQPTETRLENKLSSYENSTSIEITVLTIESLDGETVEDYAQNIFNEWRVGKEETDAGLLILVSVSDREWRLQTGYGLEPYLTDGDCRRIGDNNFPDNFKGGDYGKGIEEGIDDVIDILGNDSWYLREKLEVERKRKQDESMARVGNWFINLLIGIGISGILILLLYLNNNRIERKKYAKSKILDYKDKVKEILSSINKEREYLIGKRFLNKKDIISKLDSLCYDENIMNLKPTERNIVKVSEEYSKYEKSYQKWLRLKNKAGRVLETYDNIVHQRKMLRGKKNYLNRDNFTQYLKKIEGNSGIEKDMGELVTNDLDNSDKYLRNNFSKYRELRNINDSIINKFSEVRYRKHRASGFNGVNKDYLITLLDEIREKFSCSGISEKELNRSHRYLEMKIENYDQVNEINKSVCLLRNKKASIVKDLMKSYLSIKRGYNRLSKKYPQILNKYLPNFKIERSYYKEKYMDSIEKMVDMSYKSLISKEFSKADMLRERIESLRSDFMKNLSLLNNLEKRIKNAESKILEYQDELTAKGHSLFNITFKKVSDSDVSTSTIRKWNSLQRDITEFHEKTKKITDVILISKHIKKLYDSLLAIKKMAEKDIRNAEEERRRKKHEERRRREEEERRRRNSYSSSYSSSSSYTPGSNGGFGGFGGGSSGGGGASGSW